MNDQLKYYSERVTKGLMTRREFVGRAAALGVTAAVANSMLSTAARAAGPVKGGTIRMGVQGGESTNSLDPALAASTVPTVNPGFGGHCPRDLEHSPGQSPVCTRRLPLDRRDGAR